MKRSHMMKLDAFSTLSSQQFCNIEFNVVYKTPYQDGLKSSFVYDKER
jgi:hypothetical protein